MRTHTLSSFLQVFVEYKANFNFKQNTPNHHNFVSRAATLIISLLHAVFALVRGHPGVSERLPAKYGCQTTCTSETTYMYLAAECWAYNNKKRCPLISFWFFLCSQIPTP